MFSKSIQEHVTHVRTVLQTLRKERLYANMEKCLFDVDKLVFLGFVVSSKGVHVDESKINAIKTWPQPTNLHQVPSFLGLAGFYRRFVKDFSTIASPLHALSKKNAPFVWGPSQDTAFNELKNLLTHAPVLELRFAKRNKSNGTMKVKRRKKQASFNNLDLSQILQKQKLV